MNISPSQIDANLKRLAEINNQLSSAKQQNKDIPVSELISIKEESERLNKETSDAISEIMKSFNNSDG